MDSKKEKHDSKRFQKKYTEPGIHQAFFMSVFSEVAVTQNFFKSDYHLSIS